MYNYIFNWIGEWIKEKCFMPDVGDVVYYKMPYSGLAASISHKRFWQYGADENNIHGTIPDYIVPKEDALSKALELCGHN